MTAKLTTLLILCLCALPGWMLVRGGWLLLQRKRPKLWREIVLGLFVVFMTGILCMALEGKWAAPAEMLQSALRRLRTGEKIGLQPLRLIGPQIATFERNESRTQLLGNILLFMPWGFCLPLLWRRFRRPLLMAAMALLLTCGIECTQLFIDRYVEIDDVILNFLGSMGGAGLWWLTHRRWPELDHHLL